MPAVTGVPSLTSQLPALTAKVRKLICSQQLLSTVAQRLLLGIPLLSSKPGTRNILYLDFNGHTTPSSSEWGVFRARAFSMDGNRNSFNNAEKAFIENVWRRMTEDFAPFQYDVTTVGADHI